MVLNVQAKDNQGLPVAGAVLSVVRGDGQSWSFTSGADGRFAMIVTDQYPGILDDDTTASIAASGYDTFVNPQLTGDVDVVILSKKNYAPYILGGGVLLAVLAFAAAGKKKRVKGLSADEARKWIVPVGAVVAGYLVYQQIFGKSAQDKAYDDSLDEGIDNASQTAPPVMTDAEIELMATTLSNDISSFSGQTNVADILAQFERINNTAELLKLIKAYGTRWTFLLGIPRGKYTLQEALKQNVDPDTINLINQYLTNASIHFQF